MDTAAKVRPHRVPALAEVFNSLGGMDALSTLAELLDALPVGVAVIGADDASLPVLYLNSRAWDLRGAEGGEVIGRPLPEAVSAPDEVLEAVREAHRRRGRRRVRYRQNPWQSWDFEATSLRRGRDGRARVLATWHEVQERAGDAEPIHRASEPGGRDASRVRSQFLNMAAHELRTPLAVIGGYLSMLADGTLGPAPASWETPLSVLVDKSRELAHLIDDILLAGRLEGGIARTAGRSMDLSETLGDAIRRAEPRAELLAANLEMRAPHSVVRVWADPDHVGRILDNLVNNAFNYSPAPPRVTVTVETDAESAVVRVEDKGRGVARDNRDRIFQQFVRVDDPADGYPPGTGLGLFISRALAERYGGSLELEWSELGVGSRFALRLPLARSA
jgi:signal transduction histidine kinase